MITSNHNNPYDVPFSYYRHNGVLPLVFVYIYIYMYDIRCVCGYDRKLRGACVIYLYIYTSIHTHLYMCTHRLFLCCCLFVSFVLSSIIYNNIYWVPSNRRRCLLQSSQSSANWILWRERERERSFTPYIHTSIHPYIHTSIHPYTHTPIHPYINTSIHPYKNFTCCPGAPPENDLACFFQLATQKIIITLNTEKKQKWKCLITESSSWRT